MPIIKLASCWRAVLVCVLALNPPFVSLARAETGQPQTEAKPLTLGYFPIISTVALFKRFAPLRDYLAQALGRPVELQTAKDFPTFVERTDARQYDIVVTAPHFAVRASDSGKYRVRAAVDADVEQLLVVRADSPVTEVNQLAGKRIATPPADALMTMIGVRYLQDAGLTGAKAPQYSPFVSHNAANEALLAKDVDAVIGSSNIIGKAIKAGRPYRILVHGLKLPNMATLVAVDLDTELGERIVQILVGMSETEKGREALKQIGFPGYRAVSAGDYEPARPFMEQGVAEFGKRNKQTD